MKIKAKYLGKFMPLEVSITTSSSSPACFCTKPSQISVAKEYWMA